MSNAKAGFLFSFDETLFWIFLFVHGTPSILSFTNVCVTFSRLYIGNDHVQWVDSGVVVPQNGVGYHIHNYHYHYDYHYHYCHHYH